MLADGIYNITFTSEDVEGQYSLDVDESQSVILSAPNNNSDSQKWHVTYDDQRPHHYNIWNSWIGGKFLRVTYGFPNENENSRRHRRRMRRGGRRGRRHGEPKKISKFVLSDNREGTHWRLNPLDPSGYEISKPDSNLVINVNISVGDDGLVSSSSLSLQPPILDLDDLTFKSTKWEFRKLELAKADVHSLMRCTDPIAVYHNGSTESHITEFGEELHVYMLACRTNSGKHGFLTVSSDKEVFISPNDRPPHYWYVNYNDSRECYTIQDSNGDGKYLSWTTLALGSNLVLSETRTFWEIYRDRAGLLQIRAPNSTLVFVQNSNFSPGTKLVQGSLQHIDVSDIEFSMWEFK